MPVRRAQFSGGPHDGESLNRAPTDGPYPDRFLAITFDDGSRYAWAGQSEDDRGEPTMLLRYDPDHSLAKARLPSLGIDPAVQPPYPDNTPLEPSRWSGSAALRGSATLAIAAGETFADRFGASTINIATL
jgi:hypothetical protein